MNGSRRTPARADARRVDLHMVADVCPHHLVKDRGQRRQRHEVREEEPHRDDQRAGHLPFQHRDGAGRVHHRGEQIVGEDQTGL